MPLLIDSDSENGSDARTERGLELEPDGSQASGASGLSLLTEDSGANVGGIWTDGFVAVNGLAVADGLEMEVDSGSEPVEQPWPQLHVSDSEMEESCEDSDHELQGALMTVPHEGWPLASDFTFSFTWAARLWVTLKNMLGEERILSQLFSVPRVMSTHFSGLGTAEAALAMLAAAGRDIMRAELTCRFVFACDTAPSCRWVLQQRLDGGCVYKDILDRFQTANLPGCVRNGALDYVRAQSMLLTAPVTLGSPCSVHHGVCDLHPVDGDVSGSPCIPWSRASTKVIRGRQHPCVVVLLAWCAWVRCVRPSVAIHENVVGFDVAVLTEMLGDLYWIQHVRVSPSDMGFPFIRRPRLYSVLIRRAGARPPPDMQCMYAQIVDRMQYEVQPEVSAWAWRAPIDDLLQEENATRTLRGLSCVATPSGDWSYLLTEKQAMRLQTYQQCARPGVDLAYATYNLSQNPQFAGSTTGLPTFKRGSGRLWSPSRRRWLVRSERLAAMGYPVFQDLANAARVPREEVALHGPAFAIGNAMHVANVGCLLALAWLVIEPA